MSTLSFLLTLCLFGFTRRLVLGDFGGFLFSGGACFVRYQITTTARNEITIKFSITVQETHGAGAFLQPAHQIILLFHTLYIFN